MFIGGKYHPGLKKNMCQLLKKKLQYPPTAMITEILLKVVLNTIKKSTKMFLQEVRVFGLQPGTVCENVH